MATEGKKEEICYEKSKEYWAQQPATVNGMLGGFDFVSDADIEHSQKFLNYFLSVMNVIVFYKHLYYLSILTFSFF